MYTYIKYLIISIVFAVAPVSICGQQVTKEQLLKLFYQAHVAQNENNYQEAIETYTEILKLSPGLPDPYLQLGNIYADMVEDISALKKACICYANYLKLKPEVSEADALKNKISYLTAKMKEIERQHLIVDTTFQVERVILPENKKIAVIPEEEKKATIQVAKDTASVIRTLSALPVDDKLLGRWISDAMGDNGREMWILDILSINDEVWIQFNDSSFMKKKPLLVNLQNWKAKGMTDGNEFVFTLKIEQRKDQQTEKRNVIGDFGTIVSEMFDVDWDSFSDPVPVTKDKISSQEPESLSTASDSLFIEPLIIHTYVFRLKFDGYKLAGILQNHVVDLVHDNKVLADTRQNIELFKAPNDYLGFTFNPISEELKSTKKEFRELLNQKVQESMENTSALNDLGCLYASGIGIRQNVKMAVAYFMEASMKNNLFGMLNMAQLYLEGWGVDKDLEKARGLYLRAYEAGYTDAMVLCGDSYLEGTAEIEPDYKEALICYQKAVLRHCPYAAYRLGWLYNEGLGVAQDVKKAWEYYQQAVSMQYPEALTDVGVFYRDGKMVKQDYTKALEYLMKAVNKGNTRAMYELSQMYLKGDGVAPNFKLAKEWLYKSMEANDKIIDGYNTLKLKLNSILHQSAAH